MSITISEARASRTGVDATDQSSRSTLMWNVKGSDDINAMRLALAPSVPAIFDGLLFSSLERRFMGPLRWRWTATYVHPTRQENRQHLEEDQWRFSFDTGGATERVYVALETTVYTRPDEDPPDHKDLIGGLPGDRPEGADIIIPALKLTLTVGRPSAAISLDYVRTLKRLTGRTNDADWWGFAEGELLFMGASGAQGSEAPPNVDYHFLLREDEEGLSFGDITGVNHKAHHKLWVLPDEHVDDDAGEIIQQPKAIFVQRVMRKGDYADLGLGTTPL